MSNINSTTFDSAVTLPTRRGSSTLLAVSRAIAFGVTSVVSTLIVAALNVLHVETGPMCRWYFATATRLLGVHVITRGQQSAARPRLVVANHVSYFDIFVLGGLVRGTFVAKADISSWPLFGTMGKVGKVVFIDRRRTATGTARDGIKERLDAGDTLIMFPESTSHDGNRVRPFKSALFTVAERPTADGRPVTVQPVSVAYTRLNGVPMGVGWRSFFAWYGDMDLMPHVWHAIKQGTITAEVTFHAPVTISEFEGRKALAAHCTQVSGAGVARLLCGRETA